MIDAYKFNVAEGCLWFLVSGALFVQSTRDVAEVRKTLRVLAVAFLAFGISDRIEARTGAW